MSALGDSSVGCVHRATDSHQTEQCGLCTPGYRQPPNRTVWTVYTGLQTATKPNSVDCVHRAIASHQTEQCRYHVPVSTLGDSNVDCVHRATDKKRKKEKEKRKEKRERRYLVPVTAVARVLTWDCRWAVATGVCIALTRSSVNRRCLHCPDSGLVSTTVVCIALTAV